MHKNIMNVFVKRVIDGDSFKVDINGVDPFFGSDITIRVRGVNCHELRSPVAEYRMRALLAKQFTESWIRKTGFVDLLNVRRGKYYRLVADVRIGKKYLSGALINAGHGVKSVM